MEDHQWNFSENSVCKCLFDVSDEVSGIVELRADDDAICLGSGRALRIGVIALLLNAWMMLV